MFRRHCRDHHRAIVKALPEQLPNNPPHPLSRLGRQTPHLIEVLLEAEDLLIDRRCAYNACWSHAERSQHQEQVPQRSASIFMIFGPAPFTLAMCDVSIEKADDDTLLDRGA